MANKAWDDRFFQFARNQRWGTCASCPSTGGHVFPEFCVFTDRSDHRLNVDDLIENYKIRQAR